MVLALLPTPTPRPVSWAPQPGAGEAILAVLRGLEF